MKFEQAFSKQAFWFPFFFSETYLFEYCLATEAEKQFYCFVMFFTGSLVATEMFCGDTTEKY
jgi:hypothetical protein